MKEGKVTGKLRTHDKTILSIDAKTYAAYDAKIIKTLDTLEHDEVVIFDIKGDTLIHLERKNPPPPKTKGEPEKPSSNPPHNPQAQPNPPKTVTVKWEEDGVTVTASRKCNTDAECIEFVRNVPRRQVK